MTARVIVNFTEAVQSVTTASATLWRGATKVSVSVYYNPTTHAVTITPKSHLARGVKYTVKLTSAIHDLSGNPFAAVSWSFTTA